MEFPFSTTLSLTEASDIKAVVVAVGSEAKKKRKYIKKANASTVSIDDFAVEDEKIKQPKKKIPKNDVTPTTELVETTLIVDTKVKKARKLKGVDSSTKLQGPLKRKKDSTTFDTLKSKKPQVETGTSTGAEEKKKKRTKASLYHIPKPMTAYFCFQHENRPKLKAINPEAEFGDLSKMVSTAWRAATAEQKAPYETEALVAKQKRDGIMAALPTPPKPPQNCYFLFSDVRRKELVLEFPANDMLQNQKILGTEWSGMSVEKRAPFTILAKALKAEYNMKLDSFNAKYPSYGQMSLEALLASVGYVAE
jgi:hypothetical protein